MEAIQLHRQITSGDEYTNFTSVLCHRNDSETTKSPGVGSPTQTPARPEAFRRCASVWRHPAGAAAGTKAKVTECSNLQFGSGETPISHCG